MTAIFYPDLVTRSPDGRFTLDARSPHNGTIPHRDGRAPSDNEFGFKYRDHQSHFRYRLTDAATGEIVWERWQPDREDSPGELVAANDGWAVIRTHGFGTELVAVDPSGRDAVRVEIGGSDTAPNSDPHGHPTPTFAWAADRMAFTTAGYEWTDHSWRYFVRVDGRPHFVWRCWWGDRVVIDLAAAELISPSARFAAALDEAEARGVTAFLAGLLPRMDQVRGLLARKSDDDPDRPVEYDPLLEAVRRVTAAAHLAGVNRAVACVPALRAWEPIDYPSYSTGCSPLGSGWWSQVQLFRPVVHHALRRLGEEPGGYPAYYFTKDDRRAPLPERISDRPARLNRIIVSMSPPDVLRLVGVPDHVRRGSLPGGPPYRWSEVWEYDTRLGSEWETVELTWEERGRGSAMTATGPAPARRAVSDARAEEILDH